MYGVIYTLIDGINDKEYVGQTTRSVEKRFYEHKYGNQYIDRAIQVHGEDMFSIVVLKECESKEELDYWERHFIKSRNTKSPNGYNLTGGGEGTSGEDNPFYGKHHTAEALAKMSAVHKGKPGKSLTPEKITEMSTRRRGETPFKNLLCEMDKKNLSFRGLAKMLGFSHQVLSSKMRNKHNFTREQVAKLEEIFLLPAEYLLERDDGQSYMKPPTIRRGKSPYKNLLSEIESRQFLYTELATNLEISSYSFSRKMLGKVNFTAKDIAKLEEIFGLPAEYLLKRD